MVMIKGTFFQKSSKVIKLNTVHSLLGKNADKIWAVYIIVSSYTLSPKAYKAALKNIREIVPALISPMT